MFTKSKPAVIGLGLIASMLIISILVLSVFGFNRINMISADYQNSAAVEAPSFSHESGFYDNPFYLKINVPKGTTVYYTLDCSDPDTSSLKYTAKSPIYLKNATENKNVYSARTDTSAGFLTDLIKSRKNAEEIPGYVVPKYNVDKCNVVRAVAVTKDGRNSEIVTGSYFVGISADSYENAKIVSIVTDPDNLFDSKKGIYVLGDKFEEYINSFFFGAEGDAGSLWRWWDANYRQKGKKWKRDAQIYIFDTNADLVMSEFGKIGTKGGGSRGQAHRSLNFSINNNNLTKINFFDNTRKFHSLSLSSARIAVFKDFIMSDCTDKSAFSTMHYIPCVLFLEGEYWGFYYLTEKYDEYYISQNYNVDAQNVVLIKSGDVEVGSDNHKKLYNEMRYFISSSDMRISDNYNKACSLIDIDSYIDYFSTMAYIARNGDWPYNNEAAWRTVKVTDGKYADGKWRWMLFDCNSACMTDDLIKHNTLQYIVENDAVFASLWKNSSFRARFKKRIFEIADECFESENMKNFIDIYGKNFLPMYQKSWIRYYGTTSDQESYYLNSLESCRNFFTNRRGVVESWFD